MSYDCTLPSILPTSYNCNIAATQLLLLLRGAYWSLHPWDIRESHAIYHYIDSILWFYIVRTYHIFCRLLRVCFLV
jgi:hypothetical protein